MRPPSATQSRAVAVAPAPRGFPVVACPESIVREHRMSITYAHINNEAEAVIVRRIYELYADGKGLAKIVKRLNAEGVRSPRGNGWAPSCVREILHRTVYWGK